MTTGMIIPAAMASSVDVSVVDVTAPTGSVSLAPGGSGAITINMVVTGNQAGTCHFSIYKDWTLSGGAFTGSNIKNLRFRHVLPKMPPQHSAHWAPSQLHPINLLVDPSL